MAQSVFASRDFRLFYAGQATSYIGDGLRTVAVPLLVFQLTGSALNLGMTYAIEFFTFGVFSLIGGSLADRLDRKRLMIACDIVRFAILASFAVAAWRGLLTLPFILIGITVHAACGAIFNGGQASSIPYILGKDRATPAVATLEGTLQAVNTIVPPIGGALFGLIGAVPALALNACTYLASQISLAAMHDLGPNAPGKLPTFREFAHDIGMGFRFLRSEQVMLLMAFASLAGNGVGMIGFTVLVPYIERDLGAGHFAVGAAFGAMGLGSVVGSLVATRLSHPFGRIVTIGFLIESIGWAPLIWTHSLPVVYLSLAISWAAGAFAITNVIGWRMRVIPGEMTGRVFGAVRILALSGALPGGLAGGFLAQQYGARLALTISIVAFFCVNLAIFSFRSVREERR